MIQFLFRKSEPSRSATTKAGHPDQNAISKQWTNRLASIVEDRVEEISSAEKYGADLESLPRRETAISKKTLIRLEGPYFTPADPSSYDTVICLVAGTGISGAIAIAAAFSAQSHSASKGTSNGSRLAMEGSLIWKRCVIIWSIREADYVKLPFFQDTPGLEVQPHLTRKGCARLDIKRVMTNVCGGGPTWVYISGPSAFIEAGEQVCRAIGVEYFGASWA